MDLSIIIPTYDRPKHLGDCLKWVARLEFSPHDFEVLVVDDGSPDPLDSVVNRFREKLNIKLLRKHNGGPASARNLGAEVARGRHLAFLDDDCRPRSNWLKLIAKSLAENPKGMVGGQTINRLSSNPYSTASQCLVDIIYEHFNTRESPVGFFTSNNLAVSTKLFRQVGGFDSRFDLAAAEDREFCDRWTTSGHRLHYVAGVVVYHVHHMDCARFIRQHVNYGRGAHLYHEIRSQRGNRPLKLDLQFHGHLLKRLVKPVPNSSVRYNAEVSAALILSQLSYVTGYMRAKLLTNN